MVDLTKPAAPEPARTPVDLTPLEEAGLSWEHRTPGVSLRFMVEHGLTWAQVVAVTPGLRALWILGGGK